MGLEERGGAGGVAEKRRKKKFGEGGEGVSTAMYSSIHNRPSLALALGGPPRSPPIVALRQLEKTSSMAN